MTERQNPKAHAVSLARLWRRHGWLVIGLLWVMALVLGCIGFALDAPRAGKSGRFFDVVYRTLQLIPMNSGDVSGASWPLDAARFLVPFLAAWAAVRALLSLFRDRWQQLLLRFWRDHIIICGLSRKGWLLARGFAERGYRVVVVEPNEDHDLIGACRERGIVVVVGDATDPDLQQRVGVLHAGHLVAVTDDDGVNAEIAMRAQGLLRAAAHARGKSAGQRRPLTCTVHLVDTLLYELARTREMALEEGAPLRLELFNVFDRGARLLWHQFAPVSGAGDAQIAGCSAHVLVIGLGRLGESLVACAGRDWHARLRESRCSGRLRITVVDLESDWKCRALSLRYPRLASACDIVPLTMDVRWPQFYQAAFLVDGADVPPVSAVFVCFDDDSLALCTGLVICQRLLDAVAGPRPVVVRMAEAGGLARLVNADGDQLTTFANLHAFGLLDRTCTPETIQAGTHEGLARALHEVYTQRQQALGDTVATNPSLIEWDHLPEELRESNRAAADGIFRHLATLGCTLIPLTDWDAALFHFSEPEISRLAESEHNRFVAERLRQGWRHTPGPKDRGTRVSAALVPWAVLPEDERAKICSTMRELPATLARAGFQIVRLASAAGSAQPLTDAESPSTTGTDRREIVARAIHERYRENQRGIKPADDPAMQPWESLGEHLRETNRQQAEDMEAILRAIGCRVRPAVGHAPVPLLFTEDEVETMAALAHENWVAGRRRLGWVSGPERDVSRKITPYLVPYANLAEDAREWDRQAVRSIPDVLAAAGFEVYRLA